MKKTRLVIKMNSINDCRKGRGKEVITLCIITIPQSRQQKDGCDSRTKHPYCHHKHNSGAGLHCVYNC